MLRSTATRHLSKRLLASNEPVLLAHGRFLCDRISLCVVSPRNMSDIKQISTPKAAQPVAAYSQAIQAGNQIFVSGQIPMDAAGTLIEGSISDKTTACIEGLKNILEAAGSSLSRVVKVTVFLNSMDHFAEMNGVYEQYFGATRPARSCVAVKELPKGVPVEFECVALSGSG